MQAVCGAPVTRTKYKNIFTDKSNNWLGILDDRTVPWMGLSVYCLSAGL